VRAYTSTQITAAAGADEDEFLPQSVPSYSATEVLATLHTKYPEYAYKEATLNPTNPRDRAVGWEVDIVNAFRGDAALKEYVGQRDTPTGPSLYIARPLRITDGACLRCHSSVEAAPRTMVERYGPANGFGWQMNEVIGAQVVSVPMACRCSAPTELPALRRLAARRVRGGGRGAEPDDLVGGGAAGDTPVGAGRPRQPG
jgi:hypothetical protein